MKSIRIHTRRSDNLEVSAYLVKLPSPSRKFLQTNLILTFQKRHENRQTRSMWLRLNRRNVKTSNSPLNRALSRGVIRFHNHFSR